MVDDRSPKTLVAEWIREQIKDRSSISLSELSDAAVEHFAKDPTFIAAFLKQMLRPIVYDLAKEMMRKSRGASNVVEFGDQVMTKEAMKARSKVMSARWQNWMEHVGDKHVRLWDMTKAELKLAAAERRRRGLGELELADLWDAIGVRLEDNETVGQRFSIEDIERVRASLQERKAA